MPEHAVYPSNGHNLKSLHKNRQGKTNKTNEKNKIKFLCTGPPLTNTNHIGWFFYISIYIFIYIYKGVYGRYIHLLQSQYNYK